MTARPLTRIAQEAVARVLRRGDRAIDATVGNGHDLAFLAAQVGHDGQVIGLDIQPAALRQARARLASAGLERGVQLYLRGHQEMASVVPSDWMGRVTAVMFNLGYLPGSDKATITRATTTVPALDQALSLLRRGGLISILAYRGHGGGKSEADAVRIWLEHQGADCRVTTRESPGPVLHLVERLG